MNKRIYLSSPHMSDEGFEQEYIKEAFDTNWIAPLGKNVDQFEKEFSSLIGANNAVALSSGTAAIHLALKAIGIQDGDIVFCQSFTFSATANPILYERAIPVFIGSNTSTWSMAPEHLESAFQKYPNVKAVIVVHLYGLSANINEILGICKRYHVPLIEDAAESLGSTYYGKQTGTFGDYGIFSFNGNKIITTSGGGMLVSDNKERIDKARFWATQSRDQARHYQHSEIGYNYRMSNVLAGIGRGQLKVLYQRVEKKKYIFDYYQTGLKEITDIKFMPMNEWSSPNCWLSCVVIEGEISPESIMIALEKENIESRPIWKPMHLQPIFLRFDYIGNHVEDEIFLHGLCLPSDTKMTNDDLDKVISIIKSFW